MLSAPLAANPGATGSGLGAYADANAQGSVVNQSSQYVQAYGGYLPQTKFGPDGYGCPTGQFGAWLAPNYSDTYYGHQSGGTIMVGGSIPFDLHGTIKRCRQGQEVQLKLSRQKLAQLQQSQIAEQINVCVNLQKQGIRLDPTVKGLEWSVICQGLMRDDYAQLQQENATLRQAAFTK